MKLLSALVCEDIRIEKSGKYTLVGANTGVFTTPKQIKVGGPGFAIWAVFQPEDGKAKKSEIHVKLTCKKHENTHFSHGGIPLSPDQSRRNLVLNMKMPFAPAFHDGEFTMMWSEDGETWETLIKTYNLPNKDKESKAAT